MVDTNAETAMLAPALPQLGTSPTPVVPSDPPPGAMVRPVPPVVPSDPPPGAMAPPVPPVVPPTNSMARVRGANDPIEVMLVTDVERIAQRINDLLKGQNRVHVGAAITDGATVLAEIAQRRPDVVMIDALLQRGRGIAVAKAVREANIPLPIIMTTVPERPLTVSGMGIAQVLQMPLTGSTIIGTVERLDDAHRGPAPVPPLGSCLVYSGKGGVGKTMIAHNLAAALAMRPGVSVALVDGSLQAGDLRLYLNVPAGAPSILQLPTTKATASDMAPILWQDPAGVAVLLAPRRIEDAELLTERDMRNALTLLRDQFDVVIVDSPTAIDGITLALFDEVEVILSVVTPDRGAVSNAKRSFEVLVAAGFPKSKIITILNRCDAPGLDLPTITAEIGAAPACLLPDDPVLVASANAGGASIVTTAPDTPLGRGFSALAGLVLSPPAAAASAGHPNGPR